MSTLQAADVRAIVVETLAEQQRLHHDDIDAPDVGRNRGDCGPGLLAGAGRRLAAADASFVQRLSLT